MHTQAPLYLSPFFFFFNCRDGISLCSPVWSQTHNPLASTSLARAYSKLAHWISIKYRYFSWCSCGHCVGKGPAQAQCVRAQLTPMRALKARWTPIPGRVLSPLPASADEMEEQVRQVKYTGKKPDLNAAVKNRWRPGQTWPFPGEPFKVQLFQPNCHMTQAGPITNSPKTRRAEGGDLDAQVCSPASHL